MLAPLLLIRQTRLSFTNSFVKLVGSQPSKFSTVADHVFLFTGEIVEIKITCEPGQLLAAMACQSCATNIK